MGLLENRGETPEELRTIISSIDDVAEEVVAAAGVTGSRPLTADYMIGVMQYLRRRYPFAREAAGAGCYVIRDNVIYFDVGFALVKRQIAEELWLPRGKKLFMDGMMGWIFYNPGRAHREAADAAARKAIKTIGLRNFVREFVNVTVRFGKYVERGDTARLMLKQDYDDMFCQYAGYPQRRMEELFSSRLLG